MTAAGIDVCKASLDLAVDGQPGVVGFANNRAGITKLVKRLQALKTTRIVVEATGGYEAELEAQILEDVARLKDFQLSR